METSSNYPFEGIDGQSLPGWGEGTPVTIMPAADADEAIRLLREAEKHLQEALETYQGEEWQASAQDVAKPLTEIRALLARLSHTERGSDRG